MRTPTHRTARRTSRAIGASDGGAHIASFATYGDTGYLFSGFVRARHLSLEHAVKKITADTPNLGPGDRGLLQQGMAADVVVFDAERIDRGCETPVHDMPGGDALRPQGIGVDTVMVNGQIAWSAAGGYTDALPGTLATV